MIIQHSKTSHKTLATQRLYNTQRNQLLRPHNSVTKFLCYICIRSCNGVSSCVVYITQEHHKVTEFFSAQISTAVKIPALNDCLPYLQSHQQQSISGTASCWACSALARSYPCGTQKQCKE